MKKYIKSPQLYCMNPLYEVLEQQNLIWSDRNQNSGCLQSGRGGSRGFHGEGGTKEPSRKMEMFCILIGMWNRLMSAIVKAPNLCISLYEITPQRKEK